MSIAMTDEQRALADAVAAAAGAADPDSAIAGIGLAGVAVPEELGGAGSGVADLAAGLEAAAERLAAPSAFGSALAALALARTPEAPVAKEFAPALVDGGARAAVAVSAGTVVAHDGHGDTAFVASGTTPVLMGDRDADVLVLAAEQRATPVWFAVPAARVRLTVADGFDLGRPALTAELDAVPVAPEAVLGSDEVPELAATLVAAEASGVAAWCVRTACDHARVREQFGRPVGAFQAVQHLCAEMLCQAESAAALAWDAARAADAGDREQLTVAATVAAAGAPDAAVAAAKDCIQVLGGIGFTWEHDAHRYLRRAVALRQWLGGARRWRRRAGELTLEGARRRVGVDVEACAVDPAEDAEPAAAHSGSTVDVIDTASLARTRAGAAALAAELADATPKYVRRRLADTGALVPHWPRPYGLDATPAQQLVIDTELERAGVPRPDLVVGAWALPTILQHGDEHQRERFVRPTLRGELTWCQLFSEPGAGSDLASLRTSAERVDGGWRLTGQKVWTSLAHEADWAICLARTDSDAPKHRGITYFLVDMRAEGIEVRPLREITGEARFNEVFLDGVLVPDRDVVGPVHGGWPLARTTLANERVALGGGSAVGEAVEELVAAHPGIDPERLGGLVVDGCAVSVLGVRDAVRRIAGGQPGAESSVQKLLGVRHRQQVAEAALDEWGEDGVLTSGPPGAAQHEFLLTRCLSIAGGTTQVLSNVVAQRILGLPRH